MLIKQLSILKCQSELSSLPDKKLLINTINAHCYNMAQKDTLYEEVLTKSDVLIPDGISVVQAVKWLKGEKIERIAGWDLFMFEMERLNKRGGGNCFFLGSSEKILALIKSRVARDFKNIRAITCSPPYKTEFSEEENSLLIDAINAAQPDLLWIGMTAPKQEKWAYTNIERLNINCHIGTIGAVFDFYAGTLRRAPQWCQNIGLEWLHRLIQEPRRLWKRYLLGTPLFMLYMVKEKFFVK